MNWNKHQPEDSQPDNTFLVLVLTLIWKKLQKNNLRMKLKSDVNIRLERFMQITSLLTTKMHESLTDKAKKS